MYAAFRHLLIAVLAAAGLFGPVGSALAGWVTLQNDTRHPVVVRDITTAADGTVKRGKPTTLYPGESVREFHQTPGVKRVEVNDARTPNVPGFRGPLNCTNDCQTFAIGHDGNQYTVARPALAVTTTVASAKK